MKHLFLFFLFSGSLSAFSQVADTMQPLREYNWSGPRPTTLLLHQNPDGSFSTRGVVKPDTLRAYILITMCRRCAAEPMPGYVVITQGKRPVYLDCQKNALKWPQVGWG